MYVSLYLQTRGYKFFSLHTPCRSPATHLEVSFACSSTLHFPSVRSLRVELKKQASWYFSSVMSAIELIKLRVSGRQEDLSVGEWVSRADGPRGSFVPRLVCVWLGKYPTTPGAGGVRSSRMG